MRKFALLTLLIASLSAMGVSAQSLEDLNIQIHGYATQGFIYTNNNNILTTNSSSGSPAWFEAVMNVGAQPTSKLRVGVQARYFLLGNYGNEITLGWAQADYHAGESWGVRVGKVKTPSGLFNDVQDIDPSYTFALLPQSVYPISSRNSVLAHYGGVLYGTLSLSKAGKVDYRAWGGERELGSNDGYFVSFRESGIIFPNGLNGATWGEAIHWRPVRGLMAGASLSTTNKWTDPATATFVIPAGPEAGVTITMPGQVSLNGLNIPSYFGKYEKDKLMVAGEWTRLPVYLTMAGISPVPVRVDSRGWYGMATYKLTSKLTGGAYNSQFFDEQSALGAARYSKDWAASARYDFSEFLYAKAEEHFINGTGLSFDAQMNPNGLKPDTKMTVLKMGVSF